LDIAILDSLHASHCPAPTTQIQLSGSPITKATERASIVAGEALQLLPDGLHRKPKVVNIGAVGNIIVELKSRGFEVSATDLNPNVVGTLLHGVVIQSGEANTHLIQNSDIAVITGMTISNGSIDELLSVARECNTKVVIFAQSGASFARFYLDRGASSVVAEPFPFYIFQGISTIGIYRRHR
jgi:uncharacterized protein (DUF4213/DUF364 family)